MYNLMSNHNNISKSSSSGLAEFERAPGYTPLMVDTRGAWHCLCGVEHKLSPELHRYWPESHHASCSCGRVYEVTSDRVYLLRRNINNNTTMSEINTDTSASTADKPSGLPRSTEDADHQSRYSDASAQQDSRLVYITCHLMSGIHSAAVVAAFIWLAYELRNGWVLLALALCLRSYKHDFNRVSSKKRNSSELADSSSQGAGG